MFGFAEHQQKVTSGWGYKVTLTWSIDDAASPETVVTDDVRIKIDQLHWYVHCYTPSIQQQSLLSKQISGKTHA